MWFIAVIYWEFSKLYSVDLFPLNFRGHYNRSNHDKVKHKVDVVLNGGGNIIAISTKADNARIRVVPSKAVKFEQTSINEHDQFKWPIKKEKGISVRSHG